MFARFMGALVMSGMRPATQAGSHSPTTELRVWVLLALVFACSTAFAFPNRFDTISTLAPTNVTETSATLRLSVTNLNDAPDCVTGGCHGSGRSVAYSFPSPNLSAGTTNATPTTTAGLLVTLSRALSGLTCGTMYSYQGKVTRIEPNPPPDDYTLTGGNRSFSTSACPTPFTLSVRKFGNGAGTVSGTGINCGNNCTETANSGTNFALSQSASAGSVFSGWSGCDSVSNGICNVNLSSDRTIDASFVLDEATLTVDKSGNGAGSVTGTGIDCGNDCMHTANSGTNVALSPVADSGSVFAGWTGCDSVSGDTCNITLQTDTTATANFLKLWTLSVTNGGTGSGRVTSAPAGIDCGGDCSNDYAHGTSITLTPVPDAGSAFTSWTGCTSITNQICTVVLNGNTTAVATFSSTATLSVTKLGTGSGTVTSAPGNINCGAQCFDTFNVGLAVTLTAVPNGNSTVRSFVGCDSRNGNTCSVTLDANKIVSVRFSPPITDADRTSVIQQIIQSLD